MCVCILLGAGWVMGGMELRVGNNNIIIFSLYIAASHTVHVLYIYFFVCVCVYILLSHMYYFHEHLITLI